MIEGSPRGTGGARGNEEGDDDHPLLVLVLLLPFWSLYWANSNRRREGGRDSGVFVALSVGY